MKFSLIAVVLSAVVAVTAAPSPSLVQKRTCGTLTGTALTICQDACKAACTLATVGLAAKACKAACDLGPLKERDAAPEAAAEADPGFGQKVCDVACDVACNSTVLALDQLECLKVCKSKCT